MAWDPNMPGKAEDVDKPTSEAPLAATTGSASVMGNPMTESDMGIPISQKPVMDVIKSALPPKENHELAEELLAQFPGVDRAELLKDMVSLCFYWMRWGNKREERQACDFLNEVQRIACRNAKTPNKQISDS